MTSMLILTWALLGTNFIFVVVLAIVCKNYMETISNKFRSDMKVSCDDIYSKIEFEKNRQYEELFNTYRMFQKEVDEVKKNAMS